MTKTPRVRSEVHVPSSGSTTGNSTYSILLTTTTPITVPFSGNEAITVAQTTVPLIFGTVPPLTYVVENVTDAGTHYSTVMTTTGGNSDEYHLTDYDSSEESERDHDTPPPRRRRDEHQGRGTQRRSRQKNHVSRRPTNQEYENKIQAFEEEIAQLRRDMAR